MGCPVSGPESSSPGGEKMVDFRLIQGKWNSDVFRYLCGLKTKSFLNGKGYFSL